MKKLLLFLMCYGAPLSLGMDKPEIETRTNKSVLERKEVSKQERIQQEQQMERYKEIMKEAPETKKFEQQQFNIPQPEYTSETKEISSEYEQIPFKEEVILPKIMMPKEASTFEKQLMQKYNIKEISNTYLLSLIEIEYENINNVQKMEANGKSELSEKNKTLTTLTDSIAKLKGLLLTRSSEKIEIELKDRFRDINSILINAGLTPIGKWDPVALKERITQLENELKNISNPSLALRRVPNALRTIIIIQNDLAKKPEREMKKTAWEKDEKAAVGLPKVELVMPIAEKTIEMEKGVELPKVSPGEYFITPPSELAPLTAKWLNEYNKIQKHLKKPAAPLLTFDAVLDLIKTHYATSESQSRTNNLNELTTLFLSAPPEKARAALADRIKDINSAVNKISSHFAISLTGNETAARLRQEVQFMKDSAIRSLKPELDKQIERLNVIISLREAMEEKTLKGIVAETVKASTPKLEQYKSMSLGQLADIAKTMAPKGIITIQTIDELIRQKARDEKKATGPKLTQLTQEIDQLLTLRQRMWDLGMKDYSPSSLEKAKNDLGDKLSQLSKSFPESSLAYKIDFGISGQVSGAIERLRQKDRTQTGGLREPEKSFFDQLILFQDVSHALLVLQSTLAEEKK